jgi:large subunit ribosomal protein L35
MPKLKNKAGAKKRFRFTATGKVKYKPSGKRHMMRRRPQKMIRSTRAMSTLSDADAKIVKRNFLIYAK